MYQIRGIWHVSLNLKRSRSRSGVTLVLSSRSQSAFHFRRRTDFSNHFPYYKLYVARRRRQLHGPRQLVHVDACSTSLSTACLPGPAPDLSARQKDSIRFRRLTTGSPLVSNAFNPSRSLHHLHIIQYRVRHTFRLSIFPPVYRRDLFAESSFDYCGLDLNSPFTFISSNSI